jgi:hypothetical protein
VYLERLLQINMATLAALGASLLGMGQGRAGLALGISMAAGSSVWLTDITGWFRLNKVVAYLAALIASGVCLWKLLPLDPNTVEILIPSLAELLIYLQVILLFQRKDDRIYWQLIMLSLLQVVVATLFSQGVWFGFLLIVYMLIGSSALTLLCLHRVWSDYRSSAGREPPAGASGEWPLAGEESGFASTPGGSSRSGIGRELYGRLSTIALGSFAITLILFYTVPRSTQSSWRRTSVLARPKHVVGFDDRVTLGELGQIIESPERVMEIELEDRAADKACVVEEELYLRGVVLTHYENGQWHNQPPTGGRLPFRYLRTLREVDPPRNLPLVRQYVFIEPLDRNQLFCVWPFYRVRRDTTLQFDYKLKQLVRKENLRDMPYEFELDTTGLLRSPATSQTEERIVRRQARLMPPDEVVCGQSAEIENNPDWLEPYLQLPRDPPLERLETLAERWIRESGIEENRITWAYVLTDQFQDDPEPFRYTLEGQQRNENLDPIEDFVSENRQGHCEYFATALALMLRSRGIPSRLIVGYRCDELDDQGRYRVRQLHAHTWVEAYLRPQDIEQDRFPAEIFRGEAGELWEHGAWLRLEPTPLDSGLRGAGRNRGWIRRIRDGLLWIQNFWSRYVMEMDRQRQNQAIYRPVARAVKTLIGRLGLAIGVVAAAVVLLAVLRIRRRRPRRWRLFGRWSRKAASRHGPEIIDVPFYRRMEVVLARHGLVRRAEQTQREFAAEAGGRLARDSGDRQMAALPGRVAEAFYRVRFGRRRLDGRELESVKRALDGLATCQVPQAD